MACFRAMLLQSLSPLFGRRKPKRLFPPLILISRALTSASSSSSPRLENDLNKKPLHLLFQEAVGLCRTTDNRETEAESNELKKRLRELEWEVRDLRKSENDHAKMGMKETKKSPRQVGDQGKSKLANAGKDMEEAKKSPVNLYSVFTGMSNKVEGTEKKVFKELSPDMEVFVSHLYKEGYFSKANFLKVRGKLDFSCFHDSYGRDFIKYAAEKFGHDHQEIAKWLSGRDLKTVALFGCPSLTRKQVFSAKRLRKYFEIQEDAVCSKCILKHSCKFVNQSVWKGDTKILNLAAVMRVVVLYALEDVHPDLSVPNEIMASANRLLREALKLCETVN